MTLDEANYYIVDLESSITAINLKLVSARTQAEKAMLVKQLCEGQENLEALYLHREWLLAHRH
jgi:hypothetical protein